ncbi:MAG: U32 family peptidase [Clostridia bacterium]|nr:U32 family peptidase [Clostridia bacterium]
MIRLRFESAAQIFENNVGVIILPLDEITKELAEKYKKKLYAEIPALVWEGSLDTVKKQLETIKSYGVYDVMAENIGAIKIAQDMGFTVHGGMTLNVLNSVSVAEYEKLRLADVTMSFELAFAKMRKIRHNIPIGFVGYGYLPLMKMRACPARDEKGCGNCNGHQMLTDRMNEQFRLMCHKKQYSELLNCVPVYVADKGTPDVEFQTLYFTVETKEEAGEIYKFYKDKDVPNFRRTAGLYFRELQ